MLIQENMRSPLRLCGRESCGMYCFSICIRDGSENFMECYWQRFRHCDDGTLDLFTFMLLRLWVGPATNKQKLHIITIMLIWSFNDYRFSTDLSSEGTVSCIWFSSSLSISSQIVVFIFKKHQNLLIILVTISKAMILLQHFGLGLVDRFPSKLIRAGYINTLWSWHLLYQPFSLQFKECHLCI